jgi:hypothetical protein
LVGIAFGLVSRRNIRRSRGVLGGEQVAVAGIIIGVVSLLVTCIATAVFGTRLMAASSEDHQVRPVPMGPLPVRAPVEQAPADTPAPTFTHAEPRAVRGAVAHRRDWGRIAVSDIDPEVLSLTEALDHERAAASKARRELLVLLVNSECDSCAQLEKLLLSEPIQRVLSGCWLVRLDVRQFDTELQNLGIPVDQTPAFVLLSPQNAPVDYIQRGEWETPSDENIAPILHDFLTGKLLQRRYPWGGMRRDGQTPI